MVSRKNWILEPTSLMTKCRIYSVEIMDFLAQQIVENASCWLADDFTKKKNGFSRRRLDENALKKLVKMRQSGKKTILPRF